MKTKISILAFVAVFAASLFIANFPVPKSAYAAVKKGGDLASQARTDCAVGMGRGGDDAWKKSPQADVCVEAYTSTYNDPSQKNLDSWTGDGNAIPGKCNSKGANTGACLKGAELGPPNKQQDAASTPSDGNSSNSLDQAAKNEPVCNFGSKTLADACIDGYKAGYKGTGEKDDYCQKFNGTQAQNACKNGYEKGGDYAKTKEPPTSDEGEKACKGEKFTGSKLQDCIECFIGKRSGASLDDLKKGKDANACEKGAALYDAKAKKKQEAIDCDTQLESMLSWIACPLIDMGVAMTDFIFRDFVQPMLENIPLSTDPDDPGYKAWRQFRLLANILLIGSLMMIVYSQAKGGGDGK